MAERPILFKEEMARAILAGTKVQTRRLIKPQPTRTLPNTKTVGDLDIVHAQGWRWQKSKNFSVYVSDESESSFVENLAHSCPFGRVGDRLWVKSKWLITDLMLKPEFWNEQRETCWIYKGTAKPEHASNVRYAAEMQKPERFDGGYRSALLMPRWASRITLEVTDVRAQRLHDISEIDAETELGAKPYSLGNGAVASFATLWDSINGKRAAWSMNPFVWAISFKRSEPTNA